MINQNFDEKMKRLKEQQALRNTRIQIAVGICIKYPNLYLKMLSTKTVMFNGDENTAFETLRNLIDLEPIIKVLLDTYYKKAVQ